MKTKDKVNKADIESDIAVILERVVKVALNTITEDRERQIISHRLGLFDQKRTLEKIGQYLGLTRERIRQLEKSAVANLQSSQAYKEPEFKKVENIIIKNLKEEGNVVRVHDLADKIMNGPAKAIHQTQLMFIAKLSPKLIVVDENEHRHAGITLAEFHDVDETIQHIETIIGHIEDHGQPIKVHKIQKLLDKFDHNHIHGLATLSKKLSFLNEVWGLHHWPTVNPKTIRDKIYLILKQKNKPLHFSEIADLIFKSSFNRNNVTVQATHNELIRDDRFVLIGRGVYALSSWGYEPGTVADVIQKILENAKGQPVDRDRIVKEVLKVRQVKTNTIHLNLQSKPQFRRVAGSNKYVLTPSD